MHANRRSILTASALVLVTALAVGRTTAQDPGPSRPLETRAADRFQAPRLAYPRDADFVVARVHGQALTLEDLLRHMEERHAPGLRKLVATPGGSLMLESPLLAHWVRQFADLRALEIRARADGHGRLDMEKAQAEALKTAFESWLQGYVDASRSSGRQVELDQDKVNTLLSRYQREFGLDAERKGLLDLLVPGGYPEQALYDFYTNNIYALVGELDIQQIFVANRDRQTGGLLPPEANELAYAKMAEIRARLAKDGSNFAELARRYSEERVASGRGGSMTNVKRFDRRLPAVICRAAWLMGDGEVSDVIQSSYGLHLVRRVSYGNASTLLYNDSSKPIVAETMRRQQQENLLFDTRRELEVELFY